MAFALFMHLFVVELKLGALHMPSKCSIALMFVWFCSLKTRFHAARDNLHLLTLYFLSAQNGVMHQHLPGNPRLFCYLDRVSLCPGCTAVSYVEWYGLKLTEINPCLPLE